MNGFALDTNIVSAHLRRDAVVGAQVRANARLYLPVTVLGNVKQCIRAGGGGKTRFAGGARPAFWSDTLLLD